MSAILTDLVSSDDGKNVPDEQILNIFRKSSRVGIGTQELADVVGMSRQGVKNRLDDLEDEGRVRSEKIGDVLVWDLHPDERGEVVPPEINRLVHAFEKVRDQIGLTRRVGEYFLLTGFALIFTSLSTALTTTPIDPLADLLLVVGYATAAGGGVAWAIGGGAQLAVFVTERVVYWRLTGESLRSWEAGEQLPQTSDS